MYVVLEPEYRIIYSMYVVLDGNYKYTGISKGKGKRQSKSKGKVKVTL
jgi:hypothetical protein